MRKHFRALALSTLLVGSGVVAGCTTSDVNEAVGLAANVANTTIGVYGNALDVCYQYHNNCYIKNGGVYYNDGYSGNLRAFNAKAALKQARAPRPVVQEHNR